MFGWMNRSDKVVLTIAAILALIFMAMVVKGQVPPPASQLETRPLSPMGKIAVKQIHQEINTVQADINTFIQVELETQHLKEEDGWSMNLQTDQLERHVPPKPITPPPAEKPDESKKGGKQ